jgi:F-type H+-transporting ATPase subunit b
MQVITSIILAVVEEPGEEGLAQWLLPDFAELLWGIVAFSLLMAFMWIKVFPTVGRMLDERGTRIQGQLEEAESIRADAQRLREDYEAKLADARNQAATIVDEAKAAAERLRADMLAKAEEESGQIVARAREDVEAERGRLVQELRSQVAALSVELAAKIVQRELDATQHQALVDQYINELSGLN